MAPWAAALVLLLALQLGATAPVGHACTISLNRTYAGSCSSSHCPGNWSHLQGGCPWGCAADAGQMFAIRGCCGEFVCNGSPVRCCSHEHLHPQLCRCGPPPPPPRTGGSFFVDASAPPGGDGSAGLPFATVAACAAVAARATAFSTCHMAPGVYREAVVLLQHDGLAIVGDGVGRTVLEGALPLTGLTWARHGSSNSLIYSAVLPPGPLRFMHRQLFTDGHYMPEARWPNARLESMLDRRSSWATMKEGSGWGVVADPALKNATADWSGGRATLNLGTGVFTWVREVWNFSLVNGTFRYVSPQASPTHDFQG